jgi:transcriptional regulator with XRE-family HTH domain
MNTSKFSKSDFYYRIQEIMRRNGIKATDFEKRIGMRGALSRWKRPDERDAPKPDSLIRISEEFNISIDWLLTGKKPMTRIIKVMQPVINIMGNYPEIPPGVHAEDYLAVPLVTGEIAAQYPAAIPQEFFNSLIWLHFPEVRFRQQNNLRAIKLTKTADSHRRKVGPGDIVIIDPTERQVTRQVYRKHIYAVNIPEEGGCAIKRVYETEDHWVLTSENPINEPIVLKKTENNNWMLGQVIWSWKSWL